MCVNGLNDSGGPTAGQGPRNMSWITYIYCIRAVVWLKMSSSIPGPDIYRLVGACLIFFFSFLIYMIV